MRFHMGISFSWRTIKKYLIPILLSLAALFGINFLKDNKIISFNIPKAYALEENENINQNENINSEESSDSNIYNFYSSDDSVELKGFANNVYWFVEPTTGNEILINIYILLFISFIGIFVLKFLTIIHNVSWRSR